MINKNSKTLRDFSLRLTDKKGNKFTIQYGYDMSGKHSGHYVSASINGSDFNSNKGTLNKLKSLRIPSITQLINSIGRDVTGMPENYTEDAEKLIEKMDSNPNDQNWQNLVDFFQTYTQHEEQGMNKFIENYIAASPRSRTGLLKRYSNNRRLTFINNQKDLMKALRRLYMKGTTIGKKTFIPRITGYLAKHPYHHYYKRDVDYIRKARVNLYNKVLNREYVPAK
jgi:hypothetical protein